jgi:hypothetical protein
MFTLVIYGAGLPAADSIQFSARFLFLLCAFCGWLSPFSSSFPFCADLCPAVARFPPSRFTIHVFAFRLCFFAPLPIPSNKFSIIFWRHLAAGGS